MGIIKIKEVSKSFRDKSQEILDRKNDKAKFKFLKYITYRKLVKALNCVTFSVNKGEIFGLLGPNGAGKTTLSKMIVGLLKPDKGRVLVFDKQGDDINKESRRFNVVFARANLFYELSGRENLEFYSKLYGIKNYKKKIQRWIEIFEVDKKAESKTYTYSTGEAMRFKIIKALLNQPELLVLDEPTIGLDVNMAIKIRELLKQLNKKYNVTIFLTTHYMEEADYLCDRVAILNKGKILKIGTAKEIKGLLRKNKIVEVQIKNFNSLVLKKIKDSGYVKDLEFIGVEEKIRVILKLTAKVEDFITFLHKNNLKVSSINVEEPSLADAYLYLTGQELVSDELL
ncbi:ABC transporter ATP-binding protein [Candidatus Woesearchaeota archaeon]|nr:ABC transporter ATP-binding protein [Candidatus Woesearchaeota archaeon]